MATDDWPFTPEVETGGWQVERDEEAWGRFRIEGFVEPDAYEPDGYDEASREEIADANLIAAAPRMYRALKALIAEEEGLRSQAWRDGIAVIAWIDQR